MTIHTRLPIVPICTKILRPMISASLKITAQLTNKPAKNKDPNMPI